MVRTAALTLALCLASATVQAALLGRAALTPGGTDYQAYYDTDGSITWLADANYAATLPFEWGNNGNPNSGGYLSGRLMFRDAQRWLGDLNQIAHLGVSSWRLPDGQQPDPTCSTSIPEGSSGYSCTGGELGHLFYEELGGVAGMPLTQDVFRNIRNGAYWTSCVNQVPNRCDSESNAGTNVWYFDMGNGFQHPTNPAQEWYVWAVVDGDPLAVPIPPAVWLFGSALGVMGVMRRKVSEPRHD
ncbi:MAG: hypothetical protein ABL989_11165 [Gammaproteobacteria bacterium]